MNDILPPKRPMTPPVQQPSVLPPSSPPGSVPQPHVVAPPTPSEETPVQPPKKSKKKLLWWIVGVMVALILLAMAGGFTWYKQQLQPVSPSDKSRVRVTIEEGSTPKEIATTLEGKKLIRSSLAFDVYTRLSRTRSQLQAGTYSLSPSDSMAAIVLHLVSGRVDQFSLTFLPGATLAENRAALVKVGYDQADVDAALGKTYDHPLFQDKPASADLEGYIYGETYNFDSNATVEQVLTKTFDEYYSVIQENDLINGFKKQNLNLYQGITLASIIQREVPNASDQKRVAQVFLKRLSTGMPLGSDVTYQYAAKKLGVTPSPSLDSPYNTRIVTGLPPGPIATPGVTALQAVANPAAGDYLYFLSGDDDITYFATTSEGHEANIRDHCKIKCLLP